MASLAMGPSASARGTTATKPIAMGTNTLGAYGHLFVVTDAKGAGSIINATVILYVQSRTTYRRPPDTGGCFLLNVVEVRGATSSGIFVMFYHPNKAWTFVKTKIVSAVDSSVAQTECKNSQTVFAVLAENSV